MEIFDYHETSNVIITEVISFPFTLRETKVMMVVVYETLKKGYLFQDVSQSHLADLTGIEQNHIGTTLKKLVRRNALIIEKEVSRSFMGINLNITEWRKE